MLVNLNVIFKCVWDILDFVPSSKLFDLKKIILSNPIAAIWKIYYIFNLNVRQNLNVFGVS